MHLRIVQRVGGQHLALDVLLLLLLWQKLCLALQRLKIELPLVLEQVLRCLVAAGPMKRLHVRASEGLHVCVSLCACACVYEGDLYVYRVRVRLRVRVQEIRYMKFLCSAGCMPILASSGGQAYLHAVHRVGLGPSREMLVRECMCCHCRCCSMLCGPPSMLLVHGRGGGVWGPSTACGWLQEGRVSGGGQGCASRERSKAPCPPAPCALPACPSPSAATPRPTGQLLHLLLCCICLQLWGREEGSEGEEQCERGGRRGRVGSRG